MGEGMRKEYRVTINYNGVHPNPKVLVYHALAKQFLIQGGTVTVDEARVSDSESAAIEKLTELGWRWDGKEWVKA